MSLPIVTPNEDNPSPDITSYHILAPMANHTPTTTTQIEPNQTKFQDDDVIRPSKETPNIEESRNNSSSLNNKFHLKATNPNDLIPDAISPPINTSLVDDKPSPKLNTLLQRQKSQI
mmetsp:Transcript_59887/g.71318  ORF Transcript_59887/g.71318 Transcript_59887/m.71318 type:complete len:117 (+) Transcript_59887:964-1314(+)